MSFHQLKLLNLMIQRHYKLAIKHDIDDNRMVYASYTTAVKAGGNNPNARSSRSL